MCQFQSLETMLLGAQVKHLKLKNQTIFELVY